MGNVFATPDFWVLVGFLAFCAIVIKPALKAVLGGLDSRADKIRGTLDEAEKLREEAQHVLAEYQRKQREASKEIEAIVANARAEGERMIADAEEALATSMKRREQLAHDKIAQAEADAVTEVRNHAVDIAIQATGKLLAEKVGQEQSNALIDTAIGDLSRRLH